MYGESGEIIDYGVSLPRKGVTQIAHPDFAVRNGD